MRKRGWIFADGHKSSRTAGPDAAADWVARLASDQRTREDEQQLRRWLTADKANGAAFDEHARIFNGVGALADDAEARAILMAGKTARTPRLDRRTLLGGGIAAAAAVTAALVGPELLLGKTYRTEPGEQRRLRLADGSTVMLNTQSKLRVRFDGAERRLFLDYGQAWFQVAKDTRRPFRVFVGKDEVRALGTAFDVRRDGERATVTLEEGKVAIFRDASSQPLPTGAASGEPSKLVAGPAAPAVILSPGDEARLVPAAPPAVAVVDLAHVQAWRTERIILESTPLGEAVEEFNRYGGPRLVVADPDLAALPVSGVFHTDRPKAFAEAVATSFPIKAASGGDGQIVLSRR
ncbi:FecR domain-containing protein [Caulobacter segnis]|uniref:FecR family protein n=1 Tax=Caulobacter segnis TaxID=88688 RepID=UPI002855300C|nr:FecR domain-containing protein [Caulobacter segnis]MDR6625864.1 transmembrane sensor [Caulobacter segnis]